MGKTDATPARPETAHAVAAFEQMQAVTGKANQMMLEYWSGLAGPAAPLDQATMTAMNPASQLASAWGDLSAAWAQADAAKLSALASDYWTDSVRLWTGMITGSTDAMPEPALKHDPRFASDVWSSAPVFDMVRKSYLLASHYLAEGVSAFAGDDPEAARKLKFQANQFIDAMSPANFAALNPEVLEAARESNGETLLTGLRNMLEDIRRGKLTMTDETAFEVGGNVGATPGKVIYENRLFQLIHYSPATAQVHETPLLIFPPWINKFYILDLTAEKSFIRWSLEQGLSVFVVSWRQACTELADVTLDNYVLEGIVNAIDQVLAATKASSVHTIGYCVAGTTLAITLALLATTGQSDKVKTATYFTAQVDFSEAGELRNFCTQQTIEALETASAKTGYTDGRFFATTFNMLRPTDLMWNYVVNNYLKGKDYVPFDLLYWNSDATNVPAKWHIAYIRDLYIENRLAEAGGISVAGTPIDLKQVKTPTYIQAGKNDHIAPAVSAFKLTSAFSGPHRFVLAGSGHIAGVVNPPSSGKYQHWLLPDGVPTPATLDAFRQAAQEVKGSWWPDWIAWLKPQSGELVRARKPGNAKGFAAIEDAPGRYVKERIA